MWKYLSNEQAAPETKAEGNVDDRVIEFFLGADDPDLILNLRVNNRRMCDTKYETFLAKLKEIVDPKTVVHERRTTVTACLPDWISVRDLRKFFKRVPSRN